MTQSNSKNVNSSQLLLHSIGYGLLLFMLIDVIALVFPLHIMDPIWEFQTIGALVERVPLPLIGLVFIFYKESDFRPKWELKILKLLSSASLVVGILFLLLIFLCVSNVLRINKINDDRVNTRTNQQLAQIEQTEQQVKKATDSELQGFLAQINTQNGSQSIQNPQALKNRIFSELSKSKSALKADAATTRRTRRLALIKSAVKWGLGCLIAGDLFIRVWQATRWVRKATNLN